MSRKSEPQEPKCPLPSGARGTIEFAHCSCRKRATATSRCASSRPAPSR